MAKRGRISKKSNSIKTHLNSKKVGGTVEVHHKFWFVFPLRWRWRSALKTRGV